nr:type ISP restriction/modification enzyme [Corynebacterium cystitidis]
MRYYVQYHQTYATGVKTLSYRQESLPTNASAHPSQALATENGTLSAQFRDGASTSEKGTEGEVTNGYRRVDNITAEIKKIYRDSLSADISSDDIFHFVYGKLHDPVYRTTYAADSTILAIGLIYSTPRPTENEISIGTGHFTDR